MTEHSPIPQAFSPPRNVFILSTGRTATTAFASAAGLLPGFSAAHESRVMEPFATRIDYAPNHIEADNRLIFFLPQLEEKFGDTAYYVYLQRDPELIAQSYARRWHLTVSVVRAWTHGMRMKPRVRRTEIESCCRDFVDYADSTLSLFLARQRNVMLYDIADAENEFLRFSRWLGVDRPPQAALDQWKKRHNLNPKDSMDLSLRKLVRLWLP